MNVFPEDNPETRASRERSRGDLYKYLAIIFGLLLLLNVLKPHGEWFPDDTEDCVTYVDHGWFSKSSTRYYWRKTDYGEYAWCWKATNGWWIAFHYREDE